jgi:CIC family chloride channel protein
MLKKFVQSIEKIVAWGQSKVSAKQFIFLSSVLVGISAAWAVIILKAFAHWVFSFANFAMK